MDSKIKPIHSFSISISIIFVLGFFHFYLINHAVNSMPSAASKHTHLSHHHSHSSFNNNNNSSSNDRGSRRGQSSDSLIDKIDIDSYLKNHKVLKLQIQCIVYDGPCDYVGKWLKPRIRTALLGQCSSCSEKQRIQVAKIVDYIQLTFPEEFKLGVRKYLLEVGLEIPDDSSSSMKTPDSTTISSIIRTAAKI